MNNYITHIKIEGLFGEKDIRFSPDPKVNVLAGIKGSGKSTVLRCLYKLIKKEKNHNRAKTIQLPVKQIGQHDVSDWHLPDTP